MNGKLEILKLELKLKTHAIDRLYLGLAKELSYIDELKNLRCTADRLVANGNDKAVLIVRQLDTKLEKQSSRAHNILLDLEDHEERVIFLQLILAEGETNYPASQITNIKLNQQRDLFAAIPAEELPVADLDLEFCPELDSWAHDIVFRNPAMKANALLQALDTVHSTLFKQDACGNAIADNYPATEAVLSKVDTSIYSELEPGACWTPATSGNGNTPRPHRCAEK